MRERIELTCPGSRDSLVVLVRTPWQAQYGIGHPENSGDCALVIGALDEDGEPIDPGRRDLLLYPGDRYPWYFPPDGAAQIVAVGVNNCEGLAVLEYDSPVS
jgi:hypothetical protein